MSSKTKIVSVPMAPEMADHIEDIRLHLERERPGTSVSRADAVRFVLTTALSTPPFETIRIESHRGGTRDQGSAKTGRP